MGLTNSVPENIFSQEPIDLVPTDPDQVKFENLLKICVIIESFGTHGFFGSAKHKQLDSIELTRDQLRKQFQSTMIPKEFVDRVDKHLPGKLIKHLKCPYFFPHDMDERFKADTEYFDPFAQEVIKFYQDLNIDDLEIQTIQGFIDTIKYSPEELKYIVQLQGEITDLTIQKILASKYERFAKVTKDYTLEQKINLLFKEHYCDYSIKSYVKIALEDPNIHTQVLKYVIQNLTPKKLAEFSYRDFTNPYVLDKDHRYKKVKQEPDVQVEDVDEPNEDEDDAAEVDQEEDANKSNQLDKIIKAHQFKYYSEKYIFDTTKPKPHVPEYNNYLNFLDYWELYKLDPVLVKEIVESNYLVDDYTFGDCKFTDWSFLDCAGPDVKQNIINKSISDAKHKIKNRYGHIKTLEDLIDIIIFCQIPPKFMRLEDGIKYHDDYDKLLIQFLDSIGWDKSKLDYLNWKLEIVYVLKRVV
jgi:hypothetical protein